MSYAIRNLRDVDDSAVAFGLSETQEARFARRDLGAERIGVSYQIVKPGKRQGFGHRHGTAEEIYVILSGAGRVKLDDELVDVRPFDAVRVPPEVSRAFEAGDDGLEILAFGEHHEGDTEMLADFWGTG